VPYNDRRLQTRSTRPRFGIVVPGMVLGSPVRCLPCSEVTIPGRVGCGVGNGPERLGSPGVSIPSAVVAGL
jgi:hypothetical protein